MKFRFALFAWLLLAIALAGCGSQAPAFHGTLLQPPLAVADFALTNQDGQTMHLNDFRGSPTLLFFGYTNCPDACPITLAQFKQIRGTLGADAARVRFVFVTVDPARDTPAQMKQYLANFDPTFIGLTAAPETLAQVYHAYGISVEKIMPSEHAQHGMPGMVAHTSSVFLLDDQGQVRLIYTDIPWQDVATDLRFFLTKSA